jgi:hypothetical protein
LGLRRTLHMYVKLKGARRFTAHQGAAEDLACDTVCRLRSFS